MTVLDIHSLLAPERVAVIGSTSKATGLGRRVLDHLDAARYAGDVTVLDPTQEWDADVDLAAVAVPATHVQGVLDRLHGRVRTAVVMSSGFEEAGASALRAAAGTTLIGPNSVGLYAQSSRLVFTFAQAFDDLVDCAPGGGAFLISQSGAFGVRIARAARRAGFPLDGFVGTGNETDINAADFARALVASDEHRPKVVMMYLETVRDVDALVAALVQARQRDVEVVVLYGGRTVMGAAAAASHTSALSTDFEVLAETLRLLGAHIVSTDRELLIAARALATAGSARGRRVAIVTGSGGAGVVAADALVEHGMELPVLSAELQASVMEMLPAFAAAANPVDVTAQAVGDAPLVAAVCRRIAASGEVDAILAIGRSSFQRELRGLADIPIVLGLLDGVGVTPGGEGVAVEGDLDGAVSAVAAIARRGAVAPSSPLVRATAQTGSERVTAGESLALFEDAGVAVAPWTTARTPQEARAAGDRLGWPVVVKVDGDAAGHKARAGGVRLGVDADSIETTARDLLAATGSVIVAAQVGASLELFAGVREDARFGLVLTAGLGGSHVELQGRTVTVPAGIAHDLLAARLRQAVFDRGGSRYAQIPDALAEAALRLVTLAEKGYALVEANPFAVADGSLVALDARVVVHVG